MGVRTAEAYQACCPENAAKRDGSYIVLFDERRLSLPAVSRAVGLGRSDIEGKNDLPPEVVSQCR